MRLTELFKVETKPPKLTFGTKPPKSTFETKPLDRSLLCALANAIQPGVVPHCAESPATSVEEMENIGIFLSAAAKLGVEEENLFELTALWDGMTVGAEPAAIQATLNRLAELHPQA